MWAQATGSWLLSRYADVDAAARNPLLVRGTDSFLSAAEQHERRRAAGRDGMPNHERFVQFSLLEIDGERHRRLRLLLLGALSRQNIAPLLPALEVQVQALIGEALERGELDFIEDLAARVPGHVIGELLGIPPADRPRLRRWSEDIVQFFDVQRTQEHKQLAEETTTEFAAYLEELLAARRRNPGADLLSHLNAAHAQGQLDQTELISTAMLVLMAGHGSTIDVLGNSLNALLQAPSEVQRLRADPTLWTTAVDEFFRYDAPLPYFHRYASEAIEVGGRSFPAGTCFGLLYGSANRDEAAFPDADRLDLARRPNRHLAFGRGAHLCLGNHLGRLSVGLVLRKLVNQCARIEPGADPVEYRPGLAARGPAHLPVRLSA